MTISEQLTKIQQIKADIKSALINAEIQSPGDALSGYPDLIRSLKIFEDIYAELFEIVDNETIDEPVEDNKIAKYQKYKYKYSDDDYVKGNLVEIVDLVQPRLLSGKFAADSTETDWWYMNDNTTTVSIAEYVDPETKEFSVMIPDDVNWLTFNNNTKLKEITHIPEKLTKIKQFCHKCTGLTAINIATDFSLVTDCGDAFSLCSNLVTVTGSENLNFDSTTSLWALFAQDAKIETLNMSGINTSHVTNINYVFQYMSGLITLYLTGWDFGNVLTSNTWIFDCYNLKNVVGPIYNIKNNIFNYYGRGLELCPLTHDSAMVFINAFVDMGSTQTVKFKATTFATLTEEDIAIATERGWSVVSA